MTDLATDIPAMPSLLKQKGGGFNGDRLLALAARAAAFLIILMLLSLLAVLGKAAWPAFQQYGAKFVTGSTWRPNPLPGPPQKDAAGHVMRDEDGELIMTEIQPVFGALPVIYGTAVSSAIGLVIAIPLSLGAALFLIRIAPRWMAGPVSFLIEFLAAIPSLAYGIWGVFMLVPFLQRYLEPALAAICLRVPGLHWVVLSNEGTPLAFYGRDMLCGGLVLGIMVLPIITAVSRDVLAAVPAAQIEGTLALGATWWQSAKEMLRYSKSGLFGAVMLGLARAAGETMAVTMVIGNSMKISPSPLAPSQTMASLLANQFVEAADTHRAALEAVALLLLIMSLAFNIVARYLVVGRGKS